MKLPTVRKVLLLATPFVIAAAILLPMALISKPSTVTVSVDATSLSFTTAGTDRLDLLQGLMVRRIGLQNYGRVPLGTSHLEFSQQLQDVTPLPVAGLEIVQTSQGSGKLWIGRDSDCPAAGDAAGDYQVRVDGLRVSPKKLVRMVAIQDRDLEAVSLNIDDATAEGRFATGGAVPISCNPCSLPGDRTGGVGKRDAMLVSDFGHVGIFTGAPSGLSLSIHPESCLAPPNFQPARQQGMAPRFSLFYGRDRSPSIELIRGAVPIESIDFTGLSKNRRQSTVSSGKIEFEDVSKTIDLKMGDVVMLGKSTDLSITSLTVTSGRLHAVLFGTVGELQTGRARFSDNQLPSYLEWVNARTPLLLYGGAVLFIGGLLLSVAREFKLIPGKGKS
ncbi:hypothetical protein JQ636_12425 [Bradyrhizobium japonicum]|uniref:hypothetical protein n=1 Tax=Bradyrhizobium japonicum TaxID=375 RepID=UPI001BAE45F4|nr:hypothetical protein [Bradyrhizobium japonicum]MBR0804346.1 hypothetical protein [Bradyrhizobium japonicum]